MASPLDAITCAKHGWLGHVGIHESGHAVAAILLGFDFVKISIRPGHETLAQLIAGDTSTAMGGVHMPTGRPQDWFADRSDDALTFALAGSLSESAFWKHYLPMGFEGDMRLWRIGTGRKAVIDPDEMRELTTPGIKRTQSLIAENREAILRVNRRLLDQVPHHDGRMHFGFDDPLTLSYDEVRAAVQESGA